MAIPKEAYLILENLNKDPRWPIQMPESDLRLVRLRDLLGVEKDNPRTNKSRMTPVLQLKDGEVIAEYPSLKIAEDCTGINQMNISSALRGISRHSGGYQWEYKYKKVGPKPKYGPIVQLKDGVVVGEYRTMYEAQARTGIPQGNIYPAMKGKNKTAGGYEWKFKEEEE